MHNTPSVELAYSQVLKRQELPLCTCLSLQILTLYAHVLVCTQDRAGFGPPLQNATTHLIVKWEKSRRKP